MGAGQPQTPRARRQGMLAALAMLGMVLMSLYPAFDDSQSGGWGALDLVRVTCFLALAGVLAARSTTSVTLLGRDPILDDELTRTNRASAGRYGFWFLMMGLAASLILNIWFPIALAQAAPVLLALGASAACLRFITLERRGDG